MRRLIACIAFLLTLVLLFSLGCNFITRVDSSSPTSDTVPGVQVTILDVGQGDSILVQSENSTLLIDAGTNSGAKSLDSTLKSKGVSRVDFLVGTHPHEDHIGGMDTIIKDFSIGTIYMPDVTANTKTFEDVLAAIEAKGLTITAPVPKSSFTVGAATATILGPNSSSYKNLNDYSIVIHLTYGQRSFLFTGDAGTGPEKEMLDRGYDLKSDVLKVAHHGSNSSTSEAFLKAVAPEYGVISVGKDNDYHHPHQVTLDKLQAAGVKVLRTDQNGDITFTSDGNNLIVKTEK